MSSPSLLSFPSRARSSAVPARPSRPLGAKLALIVRDLDRAIDFWCGALGFELRLRLGDSWAEVASRGFVVGLSRGATSGATQPATIPTIAIEVADLEDAIRRLCARAGDVLTAAGEVDPSLATGSQAVRYLNDPDGHRVALCELRLGPTVVPEWYGS